MKHRAAPTTPVPRPSSRPGRRPTRSMSADRLVAATAVPSTAVDDGTPPNEADPAISAATSVPTVTAAM